MVRYIHTEIAAPKCWGPPPSLPSDTMPKRMINAAICAYAVNSPSSFNPASQYWHGLQATGPVHLITAYKPHDTAPVDAAFITKTSDNWVILSLRGTEPPTSVDSIPTFWRFVDDWYQDGQSQQVAFNGPQGGLGHVHKGFHDAFLAMLMQIVSVLAAMDWSTLKGLQITGHSKGASLTFLYALWLQQSALGVKTIEVNAFAPTSVGDYTFTYLYGQQNIPTMRHIRYPDCVPYLLPFYSSMAAKAQRNPPSYDIYNYLSASGVNVTEDLFDALGYLVDGGYSGTGDVTYYPGKTPGLVSPITGVSGLDAGFSYLLSTIKRHWGLGDISEIAHAHSAALSYRPAVMAN